MLSAGVGGGTSSPPKTLVALGGAIGCPPSAPAPPKPELLTCLKTLNAVLTIADGSPGFAGTTIVFDCEAISFQAATHCSATRSEAASLPPSELVLALLSSR